MMRAAIRERAADILRFTKFADIYATKRDKCPFNSKAWKQWNTLAKNYQAQADDLRRKS